MLEPCASRALQNKLGALLVRLEHGLVQPSLQLIHAAIHRVLRQLDANRRLVAIKCHLDSLVLVIPIVLLPARPQSVVNKLRATDWCCLGESSVNADCPLCC